MAGQETWMALAGIMRDLFGQQQAAGLTLFPGPGTW